MDSLVMANQIELSVRGMQQKSLIIAKDTIPAIMSPDKQSAKRMWTPQLPNLNIVAMQMTVSVGNECFFCKC